MSVLPIPSRSCALASKNGHSKAASDGLSVRLEEPEATTSERTISGARESAASSSGIDRPSSRRFTREDKLRILRLADACVQRGQIGALLRREGIYYSTLSKFQEQREAGRLDPGYGASASKDRAEQAAAMKRIAQLEAANRRLARKLEQAELVIDIQKKVSQLLGVVLPETPPMDDEV